MVVVVVVMSARFRPLFPFDIELICLFSLVGCCCCCCCFLHLSISYILLTSVNPFMKFTLWSYLVVSLFFFSFHFIMIIVFFFLFSRAVSLVGDNIVWAYYKVVFILFTLWSNSFCLFSIWYTFFFLFIIIIVVVVAVVMAPSVCVCVRIVCISYSLYLTQTWIFGFVRMCRHRAAPHRPCA